MISNKKNVLTTMRYDSRHDDNMSHVRIRRSAWAKIITTKTLLPHYEDI